MAARPGRCRRDPESLAPREPAGQSRRAEDHARRCRPQQDRRAAEGQALRQSRFRAGMGLRVDAEPHRGPSPLVGLLRYWLLRLKTSREKVLIATGCGQCCDCRPRRAAQAAIAAHFLMLNAMEASRTCPLAFMRPT